MITHRILLLICATWLISLGLWAAQSLGAHWGSYWPMIIWLSAFIVYLGGVLLNLVDLERIEQSQLPSDSALFPMTMQFAGSSERVKVVDCKCVACEAARARQ